VEFILDTLSHFPFGFRALEIIEPVELDDDSSVAAVSSTLLDAATFLLLTLLMFRKRCLYSKQDWKLTVLVVNGQDLLCIIRLCNFTNECITSTCFASSLYIMSCWLFASSGPLDSPLFIAILDLVRCPLTHTHTHTHTHQREPFCGVRPLFEGPRQAADLY
jgi:hypothetical protein